MTKVNFWFVYFSERDDLEKRFGPHGPRFAGWLPDGKSDAIVLPTADSSAILKIWLQRHLKQDEDTGFIEYIDIRYRKKADSGSTPTDNAISRQGHLDGGPIYGQLTISDVDDSTSAQLFDGSLEPIPERPAVVALGKRVVRLITEGLRNLVRVLKFNYGQYWLEMPQKWDSRDTSLGQHCSSLSLKWTIATDDTEWADFRPTELNVQNIAIIYNDDVHYAQYMTKDDWKDVSSHIPTDDETSIVLELASYCHELLDRGNLRHALIEGATALEVAIGAYVNATLDSEVSKFVVSDHKWRDMTRVAKTALIGTFVGADKISIMHAVDVINLRNSIVHDGLRNLPPDVKRKIKSTIKFIALLTSGQIKKLPSASSANRLSKPLPENNNGAL